MYELEMYCMQLQQQRIVVPDSAVSLAQIKQILCGVFGVKEKNIEQQIDKVAKAGFGASKITKSEVEAWEKTGYKGSLKSFVKEYRNGS